jgi:hypothetical protein
MCLVQHWSVTRPVLIVAGFLVALSHAFDGLRTPVGVFMRGVVLGLVLLPAAIDVDVTDQLPRFRLENGDFA